MERMTTDIIIIYKDREVLLEVNATAYVPQTWDSPAEDPEFEILEAKYRDGELLSDDDVEFITNNEDQQIWDKLEDLSAQSEEDYLLEKHEDDTLERGRDWPWRF